MTAICDFLAHTQVGEPQVHENLAMFPLFVEKMAEANYDLLDEAIEKGGVHVTEVSEEGSVPELSFKNDSSKPVLLLDGEELIGAKQNRILNLTILAPAFQSITIPVSCVEAGRWRSAGAEFASAKRTHYARGRAKKAFDLNRSMSFSGSRRADQGEVWRDIREKTARMHVHSDTEAADEMYKFNRKKLDKCLGAFSPVSHQAGALFAVNGKVIGFDLFDSPATMSKVLPKLVESYALDAIDEADCKQEEAKIADARKLLDDAAGAKVEAFPAIGEGQDQRFDGALLSGGAVVANKRFVHVCAFRITEDYMKHKSSRMRSTLHR